MSQLYRVAEARQRAISFAPKSIWEGKPFNSLSQRTYFRFSSPFYIQKRLQTFATAAVGKYEVFSRAEFSNERLVYVLSDPSSPFFQSTLLDIIGNFYLDVHPRLLSMQSSMIILHCIAPPSLILLELLLSPF